MKDEYVPSWIKNNPPKDAEKVTGSTVATTSWVSLAAEAIKEETPEPPAKPKTSQFTAEICFIDAKGSEDSGFYLSIQGMRIRNNTSLRVFLPHVVVDIETNNARELRRIIYSKRFNEIEAEREYDAIKVVEVQFYDPDSLPAKPAS